jgi:hypothetical protein
VTVLQELRKAQREIVRLRAALGDMLDDVERVELDSNWPYGDHPPGTPRLCKILAREIVDSYDGGRDDLNRIKRARKALGLPAWWNLP